MKAKVTKMYRDKNDGIIRNVGEIVELTDERYAEISAHGKYVFPIEDAPAADDEQPDGLDAMTIRELKEYADTTYKLTFKNGTKRAEIIECLREMEAKRK